MIILDTNVISETMKPTPQATVLAWLNDQIADTLFLG
jgi:toxin FitB